MRPNSSISSSKRFGRRVALFFCLVFLGMVAVDVVLALYVRHKTNANLFVENTESKSKHMLLHLGGASPDIVFVGSSRTIFHVSTAVFKSRSLDVYNFGVSGCQIASYPSMVADALKTHPGKIVISANVASFCSNNIPVPDLPTVVDLKAMFTTGQKLKLIADSGLRMLTNLHKLNLYSQPINLRLRNIIASLDKPFVEKAALAQSSSGRGVMDAAVNFCPDCTVFDSNVDALGMHIYKCSNGDGILLGRPEKDSKMPPLVWTGIAKDYLALLNYCFDMARRGGAEPVLLLEPVYGFNGDYDLNAIKSAVHARVIDFTRFSLPLDMWANLAHLNNAGRIAYSTALAGVLAQ